MALHMRIPAQTINYCGKYQQYFDMVELGHQITGSPRQGLAVLMATAKVLLKHETSTTYQSHIYESIDLKFE